mgnify:CR=1 FL=1
MLIKEDIMLWVNQISQLSRKQNDGLKFVKISGAFVE